MILRQITLRFCEPSGAMYAIAKMKRALPFVIIIAVLGGALLTYWYLKRSTTGTPRAISPAASRPKPPEGPPKLGAVPPQALGNVDAPVMLEEFGDFVCQSCAQVHPVLKTMKQEFGPRIVIVFREFPLQTVHPHALSAAQAAEAAGLQGKFWEMHDLLYENQKAWHEASDVSPIFEQYATTLNLDLDRFRRDVNHEAVEQRIQRDRERGYWIGVTGTPTVFLNGREVPFESLASDKLRVLINTQLSSH